MKKNIFKCLSIFVMAVVCVGFASCGDDDEDVTPGGSSGGSDSGVEGKFQGPKRVFGDNLLRSYGSEANPWELTYNSDDFVTKIKRGSYEYEVSYSDNQVIVIRKSSSSSRGKQYIFTIGSNGFAESYTSSYTDGKEGKSALLKYEYDSDGHLTKITAKEGDNRPWIGTFTWQDGNLIKANDNDSWSYKSQSYTYGSINNIAGLFVRPKTSGDIGDFYEEIFHYIGLLGKGTRNLVKSYSRESRSGENAWTLDDAGRPIKCVTTSTSGDRSSSSTYVWNYR